MDFGGGCLVMGVLNVTPDSFSDGGQFYSVERAVEHGLAMAAAGAAIIDIGAESTRPGSQPVDADEQIRRAVPVIEKIAAQIRTPISIDTSDPVVAKAAVAAGAAMLNDITALSNPAMGTLAAKEGLPVCLMHIQGTPQTMQRNPQYGDVVQEVGAYLQQRAKAAEAMGIAPERIFIDPGIGFGKTAEHNLQLLNRLDNLCGLGYRVVVGTSRKRFIGDITGKAADQREFGTAATVAIAARQGVSIVRVHHVPAMVDVVKVANAIRHLRADNSNQ